jgi:hypothetical protein
LFAVAAAEQEGEPFQVGAQFVQAAGGWPVNSSSDAARRAGSRVSQPVRNCSISVSSAASVAFSLTSGMRITVLPGQAGAWVRLSVALAL